MSDILNLLPYAIIGAAIGWFGMALLIWSSYQAIRFVGWVLDNTPAAKRRREAQRCLTLAIQRQWADIITANMKQRTVTTERIPIEDA